MKKKTEFNLADLCSGLVSDLDTAAKREQIEYIDIDLLDDDPKNFYELSGVDELASNIELFGLQQPVRVRANHDAEGRYIIVSGHRRRAAIRLLVDDGKEQFRLIACIKERAEGSAALQELRLIYANSDTRRMTAAEISRQAERVETLLYQLKEEGYEFPGRMRDHVAEACKVSKSKLARLKVIREGLSSDFMEAFDRGSLTEQAAYALSRLPIDMQHRLFRVAPIKDLRGYAVEQIQKMYENAATEEMLSAGTVTSGSREQTLLAFAKRLGGQPAAERYLAQIQSFAGETNYDYDEITGYSKLLMNSYDPSAVFGVLKSLSDATAGLSLSDSDVETMIFGI